MGEGCGFLSLPWSLLKVGSMYRLMTRGAESESVAPCNARFFPV